MNYFGIISWNQSNGQGALPISNAPAGMFTGSVVNGVHTFKTGVGIVPFDVNDIGINGNGFSVNLVGSSSAGNYSWPLQFAWRMSVITGLPVLFIGIGAGGSCLSLKTLLNGSHNVDTANLATNFPTTPRLHTDLINRYNNTIAQLLLDGDTVTWQVMLPDQEEGDFSSPQTREADQLAKVASIRTLTGVANLPVIWVSRSINTNFLSIYMLLANRNVADANVNNIFKSNISGTAFDGVHFNAATITSITNDCLAAFNGTLISEPSVVLPVPNITGKEYNAIQKAIQYSSITNAVQLTQLEYYITQMQITGLWNKLISATLCLGNDYTFNITNAGFRKFTLDLVTQNANGFNFAGVGKISTSFRGSDIPSVMSSNLCVFAYLKNNTIATDQQTVAGWNQTEGAFLRLYSNYIGSVSSISAARLYALLGSASIVGDRLVTNSGFLQYSVKDSKLRIFKHEKMFGVVDYTATEFVNNLLEFGHDPAGGDNRKLINEVPYLGYAEGLTMSEAEQHSTIVESVLTQLGRAATPNNPIPTFSTLLSYAQSQGDILPNDSFLTKLQTFMGSQANVLKNFPAFFVAKDSNGASSTFASRNIINPLTHQMTFPNGVTFGVNGWTLNGTNQFGDCNYNGAVNGAEKGLLNQACRLAWIAAVGAGTAIDGVTTGSRNNMTLANGTANRINSGSVALNTAFDLTGTGLKMICRENETDVVMRNNGVEEVKTQAAQITGLLNENQFMGRSGTSYGGHTFSAYAPNGWKIPVELRPGFYVALQTLLS